MRPGEIGASVMATAKRRNVGTKRRKPKFGPSELGAGVLLLSGFMIAIIWLSAESPEPQPAVFAPNVYTGSIVIFSNENAYCRRLIFDNITGSTKDEGRGNCSTQDTGRTQILSEIANSFRGK